METFSTTRPALLPRLANLATVVVVASATWWSGAQRPTDAGLLASKDTRSAAAPATATAAAPAGVTLAKSTGPGLAAGNWGIESTGVRQDGLQQVGFQTRATR